MRTRRTARRSAGWLVAVALTCAASAAEAEPQASVGLTLGAAGTGYDRKIWRQTAFQLGLRGDVLFGRSSGTDFGAGPYLEVLTYGFNQVQFGGGASLLLPIIDPFPIVLSAGAYARKADDLFGVEPGLAGSFFFGSKSYNFHANYVMTAGLLAEMRYGLGPSKETSLVIAAQVDLAILAMPFIFLANAARGGSTATTPVAATSP